MQYENLFSSTGVDNVIARINQLSPNSQAQWGKMNASQMLAHLNVAYEMDLEDKHPAPGGFEKFMLKLFVKKAVCGPKPYPKNSRTAPQFIIKEDRDFEKEKARLVGYIKQVGEVGATAYEGRKNQSFGKLSSSEWNTMYAKHLDHHLKQFGV